MEDGSAIPIYQMSGAPLATLRATQETTVGQLISALCKKAGLEDGVLLLAHDGKVLDKKLSVGLIGLDENSVVTAIRYPEIFVAATFEDGSTRVWSAESGRCERQFEGRRGAVLCCAFSNNGLGMATGGMDSNAYFWSLTSGKCERYYQGHQGGVASIDCSSDGKLLVTGSFDRSAILWNLSTGQVVRKITSHRGTVMAVAFSKDGAMFCTGSEDCSARLWTLQESSRSKSSEVTLSGHAGAIVSVAFTPDSHHVATGSTDGAARVWNLKGKCRQLIQVAEADLHGNIGGPGGGVVSSVAFSPDGELMASGCSDGFAKVWHVRSGVCERTFKAHPQATVKVRSVDFSHGGLTLVVGTDSGVVTLYDVVAGQEKAILNSGEDRIGVRQVTFAPGPAPPES